MTQSFEPRPPMLARGDRVAVTDRPSAWPGWRWVTRDARHSAWVPEALLGYEGDGMARLLCDVCDASDEARQH